MSFEFSTENVQLVIGRIISVEGLAPITTPDGTYYAYTAESVSYTIATYVPGTSSYVELRGQKPEIRLWSNELEINTEELVGKSVIGVKVVNDIRWHFFEPPLIDSCIRPPPSPIIGEPPKRDEDLLDITKSGSGSTGAQSAPETGAE